MSKRSSQHKKLSEMVRAVPGEPFRWADWDPSATPGLEHKKQGKEELKQLTRRLAEIQQVLYAEGKQRLLVVLQAMDTGGKDGTIRHVFGPINPQGVRVQSFKSPTAEELAHDFLWRIHPHVPEKGMIQIFNRSHYEDVLIVRVHDLIPKKQLANRYRQINDFEKYLAENGVTILKFFLNISKAAQKERLQARLDNPEKHWKFNPADLDERKLWGDYQDAYKKVIEACSTSWAPWHIIPSDHKWYRNYAVAKIVLETLEGLKPAFPQAPEGLDHIVIDD